LKEPVAGPEGGEKGVVFLEPGIESFFRELIGSLKTQP